MMFSFASLYTKTLSAHEIITVLNEDKQCYLTRGRKRDSYASVDNLGLTMLICPKTCTNYINKTLKRIS